MWIEYVLVSLIPFVFMGSIFAWFAKFHELDDNPSRGAIWSAIFAPVTLLVSSAWPTLRFLLWLFYLRSSR